MSEKLKPCPFCGNPSEKHVGFNVLIVCRKCNIEFRATHKCNVDTATAWNRRAESLEMRAIKAYRQQLAELYDRCYEPETLSALTHLDEALAKEGVTL